METIKKLILPLIFLNLLVLDGAGVYFWLIRKPLGPVQSIASQSEVKDICGLDCRAYIDQKMVQASPSAVVPIPTSKTITKLVVQPTKPQVSSVTFAPIPGSGSTLVNDWTDISGTDFYFDKADYVGLQSIYFVTNIRLLNGNGQAFVRLFDVTHSIGVQGSEASTVNQSSTPVDSGQVSFWAGKNLYRVQAKSLTADTAIFDSGRLKITTRN